MNAIQNSLESYQRTDVIICQAIQLAYDHQTLLKVIEVAGVILAVGLCLAIYAATTTLGAISLIISSVGLVGYSISLAVYAYALHALLPSSHDMNNHVFLSATFGVGLLSYDGDIPVLTLDADNPHATGLAQGYLCGNAIKHLTSSYLPVVSNVTNVQLEDYRNHIPERFLREIEVLVEGYNLWANEQWWWNRGATLTTNDIIKLHMIPDLELLRIPSNIRPDACSVIIERNENQEITFGRNLDYPSLSVLGTSSLVIKRNYSDERQNTVDIGVAGLIGVLTGMNEHGLTLAMNQVTWGTVPRTSTTRQIPSIFYNRQCLEESQSVSDVTEFTRHHDPLTAYHLTTADPTDARSFHFYERDGENFYSRRLGDQPFLATLNHQHTRLNDRGYRTRGRLIELFYLNRGSRPLEDVLALPTLSNERTTLCTIMTPETRRIRLAFDNAFAGNRPLHTLTSTF